jgi:CRP-like cAMP-binding protein
MSPALRQIHAGEVVIQEGSHGTDAFELKSGRVQVTKKVGREQVVLATLEPGEVFGEMALIDDKPRSATVTAVEDGEVLIIDRERFAQLLLDHPSSVITLLRTLFERLRQTSQMLAEHLAGEVAGVPPHPISVRLRGLTEKATQALGGEEIEIRTFPFNIGRLSHLKSADILDNNHLSLEEDRAFWISLNHCAIMHSGDSIMVVDRGSRFGTIVNDDLLGSMSKQAWVKLSPGVHILVVGPKDGIYRFSLTVG